jgi:GNAT superfamily N-acetyltransferase
MRGDIGEIKKDAIRHFDRPLEAPRRQKSSDRIVNMPRIPNPERQPGADRSLMGMKMIKHSIRQATVNDAAIIARHRVEMFRDMGQVPTDALATALLEASTAALGVLLREGSYVGWLAIADPDRVIAGAGAHVHLQLPRISHDGIAVTTAPAPLVVNVYTEPDFRGMGIARALMNVLLEWATTQGCDRVVLHASDAGRPLYESLGFAPTNEMRWSPAD